MRKVVKVVLRDQFVRVSQVMEQCWGHGQNESFPFLTSIYPLSFPFFFLSWFPLIIESRWARWGPKLLFQYWIRDLPATKGRNVRRKQFEGVRNFQPEKCHDLPPLILFPSRMFTTLLWKWPCSETIALTHMRQVKMDMGSLGPVNRRP